jgi:hypothetical protein
VSEELREVRLVGFPLRLHARSTEHHEELIREFQLLSLAPESAHTVPARLVALIDELTTAYAGMTVSPNASRDAALARGDESIDLVYAVTPSVAEACARLDVMLDEADRYCREGDRLLTLAAPSDVVALRRWQLAEFVSQLGGAAPTPWPAYAAV